MRVRKAVLSKQQKNEGFRQTKKIKLSITLILWDVMFSVPTVLMNELCELTSWGPLLDLKNYSREKRQ